MSCNKINQILYLLVVMFFLSFSIAHALTNTGLDAYDQENDSENKAGPGFSESIVTPNANTYFWANYTNDNNNFSVIADNFSIVLNVSSSSTNQRVLDLFDANLDGKRDEIIVGGNKNVTAYNGSGAFLWTYSIANEAAYDMEVGDLDNDGYYGEIVIAGSSTDIRVLNSSGSLLFSLDIGTNIFTVKIGDFDEDGKEDDFAFGVRFGNTNFGIAVYNTTDGENWNSLWNTTVFTGAVTEIALADLDDNGIKSDIIGCEYFACSFINRSGDFLYNITTGINGAQAVTAGDFDNDGIIDDVAVGENGDVHVYNESGNQIIQYTAPDGWIYELVTADLDNDGLEDEILVGDAGYLWGLDNASGTTAASLWSYSDMSGSTFNLNWADVNNDNEFEVIAGGGDDTLRVLNKSGSLIYSFTSGGDIPDAYGQSPSLASQDINNDGMNDIAFVSKGNQFYVLETIQPCLIMFNDTNEWKAMKYNKSIGLYYYNRTFSSRENFNWTTKCNNTGYEAQTISSTVNITLDSSLCSPTADTDWIISETILCTDTEVTTGTGKIVINSGGKLYIEDKANVTCSGIQLNTTGDQVFIKAGSELRVS